MRTFTATSVCHWCKGTAGTFRDGTWFMVTCATLDADDVTYRLPACSDACKDALEARGVTDEMREREFA
jgi:hypothetical protein